jgi:hypothetical protein
MLHVSPARVDRPAVRPCLPPGVPVIWRSALVLSVGVKRSLRLSFDTPAQAMACAKFLIGLDGSRTWSQLMEHDDLLLRLSQRGLLTEAASPLPSIRPEARERAMAELGALALVQTSPSEAADTLTRRAALTVAVHGDGRLGTSVASLLAASGIGRVLLMSEQPRFELVSDFDTIPGGPLPDEEGTSRLGAARAAVARAAITTTDVPREEPALVIVTRDCPTDTPWIDPETCDVLVAARTPHLLSATAGLRGRVGPLVIPGHSACQRCVALEMVDRDPEWPMVAAHLIRPRRRVLPSTSVLTNALVASVTADHALKFLDGHEVLSGALDLDRSTMTEIHTHIHDRCGCAWTLSDQPDLHAC